MLYALRRAQRLQAARRLAQLWLEAADTEPGQRCLHAVDDPGTFANQVLALAARTLGVLLLERRDRHHLAVPRLAAQPAQEDAHEHRGVQPVGLRPAVLARHRDAGRMDDVGFDATSLQPPRQPETVAPSLKGERNPVNRLAGLHRLVPPALHQLQQCCRIRRKLLQRPAVNARNHSGHQPARLAHLHDNDQRTV